MASAGEIPTAVAAAADHGDEPSVPVLTVATTASASTAHEDDLIDLSDTAGDGKSPAVSLPPIVATTLTPIVTTTSTTTSTATNPPSSPLSLSRAAMYLLDVEASQAADRSTYVDPTPATPLTTSHPPSRAPSRAARSTATSPTRSDTALAVDPADDEKRDPSEDEQESGSRAEIQSIMSQFGEDGGGPDAEEVMSPRLEIAAPMLAPQLPHPHRKSSLEPLTPGLAQQIQEQGGVVAAVASRAASVASVVSMPTVAAVAASVADAVPRPLEDGEERPPVPPKDAGAAAGPADGPAASLHRPPPPEPEPEPTLPFDFQRFLEQLRNKKADPVARYLKSFLSEFAKRQWMVHEQVKIIGDFLAFIDNKMALCDVWRELSDAEFENAREGMEKLVMNRLYTQTFSPAIPPPQPLPGAKPRRRGDRAMAPGRRGQHQEDVERDEILTQKIRIYGWIKEAHLDIPPVGDSGKRFLKLAQQELLKIKSYRAPRDKIICVLNCCKVIFGLLKHTKTDSSADSFMPMLIYVVLQANPEHLVSNVQYILRFRNQEKLSGEAGYYLSSLMGAIQFIENMDRTTLTITDDEFEKNVEAAVSAIAEKHRAESPPLPVPPLSEKSSSEQSSPSAGPSGLRLSLPTAAGPSSSVSGDRRSTDSDAARLGVVATPRPSSSEPRASVEKEPKKKGEAKAEADLDSDTEPDAITGLLRTIQKPLSTIGRMFSDEPAAESGVPTDGTAAASLRHALSAEEAAARQASAETEEARRLQRDEHVNVVETLASMFPDLDREIISDVVYQKEGRVGQAVDACLALSS